MNNLNSVLLEGNLTRDPVLSFTPSGTPVCNFTLASHRYYKINDAAEWTKELSFFDAEAWASKADLSSSLSKGAGVRLVGRLRQDRWKDPEGRPHSRIKLVVEQIETIAAPTVAE
jgi:single-strand DNA-binding protein